MDLENLKTKLQSYKRNQIIITYHAELQAFVRDINLEEVKDNIQNPTKLVYAEEQKSKLKNESKYNCYFAYSKTLCHRYALAFNRKVIIVTIIKINRDWQRAIEGR